MCGVHDHFSGKPKPPITRFRLELTRFKDIGCQRHRWVMTSSRQAIRQQGRRARRRLPAPKRRLGTRAINQRLINRLRRYHRIALYWHFDGEPDLFHSFLALNRLGKQLYLPLLGAAGKMQFIHSRSLNQARFNRYGILEPYPNSARLSSKRLQAIVMPLTAYDSKGNRLGMGAGYYDKNLDWQRQRQHWRGPALIGSAWHCQQVENIPSETWDRPLDALANEQQLLNFRKPQ